MNEKRLKNKNMHGWISFDTYELFELLTGTPFAGQRSVKTRKKCETTIKKYNIESHPFFSSINVDKNDNTISHYTFSKNFNTQDYTLSEAYELTLQFQKRRGIDVPTDINDISDFIRKSAFSSLAINELLYTVKNNGKKEWLVNDETFREYFFPEKEYLKTKLLIEAENIQKIAPLKRNMFL